MKEIYLLSGLGADKRVFDFLDLKEYKLNHIEWINPSNNEPIENYAQRLLKQITTDNPILIGVSFGGMMAIEIGKLIHTEKIVLISSAKTKSDIPFYFKIIGNLGITKLIPGELIKKANDVTFWFFGVDNEKNKDLLRSIMKDMNSDLLKWALEKIMKWKNVTLLKNVTLIHGNVDRIFPHKTLDFKIDGGGHMMIVNKADQVSNRIRKVIG